MADQPEIRQDVAAGRDGYTAGRDVYVSGRDRDGFAAGRDLTVNHLNPGVTPPVVPRQLPRDSPDFTGRGDELAWLARLARLVGRGRVVVLVISGPAGVGKTALAVHAAHQLSAQFPDGQLFVSLRGHAADQTPASPDDVLQTVLRSLGTPAGEIPAGTEERSGLLRQLLASRRVVMVLDDALTEVQVRPLLPGAGEALVIVTGRSALPGLEADERIELDVLPEAEAVAVLARAIGARAETERRAVAEVARLCGRLPLALRMAGRLLATHPDWPVARLAQLLGSQQDRRGRVPAEDLTAEEWWRQLGLASEAQPAEYTVLTGGISADLVDPDSGIPKEEDDLRVSTYVAMMAAAIARTDTKLPLSIGLFGEWGSGKSYFMGLLRNQVSGLSSTGDPAYCSGIVQIGFNAWSYADANLWASLGDEIFRELAGPADHEEEAEDRKRRERLREWLADEQGRVKELEAAKGAATAEVAKLRTELEQRQHDRKNFALALLRATVQAVQADKQTAARLTSAWDKLGVKDEAEQARLLADAVTGTHDDVTAIRKEAAGHRRYLAAAIVATGLVFAAVELASSGTLGHWLSRVLAGTGVATLLAAAVTVGTQARRVADGFRSVADLASQIRERTQVGENKQVRAALDQVRTAEAREQVLQAQLDQVVARVGELGRELVELSPGQRLYAFIAERAASEDYRRQLGLIATIRRDFERLAILQDRWRRDKSGGSPRPIDRIVLYIDDLDRCTPRQVVEVLQAVHLLLALDLFVVVVGVDPRWLLHSLRDQYQSLLREEDADRLMLSTPHDYLEKIFNVPFVLPAMTSEGFGAMIRRLTATEADSHDQERPSGADITPAPPDVGTADEPEMNVPPRVEERSEIAAVQQGDTVVSTPLTEPELQALSALAPLVRSPREAKRLLNLYRMLRSTRDLSDASRFLGADGAEGEFQAVAMLLGLLTANPRRLGQILFAEPDPAGEVMGGICHRTGPASWEEFLSGLRPRCVDERWCNDVCENLSEQDRAEWELLVDRAQPASALVKLPDLTTFQTWAPHVARFSFLLAPGEGGDRTPPIPGEAVSGGGR
jgi:hypothetical protein